MQLLYALTLFTSAALLFLVQPMFAKMVLPRLGGTPGVWNTCMVFYQAALLGGYVYAHLATHRLGSRRQAGLHLVLLALPWLVLPIGVVGQWTPRGEANPTLWLLGLLAVAVGLPFLVVSTSAPMLQRWFADTGQTAGKDPYFLYAASNLGSILALLGYPILVEPHLSLPQQAVAWSVGYGLLVALIAACAVGLWLSRPPGPGEAAGPVEGQQSQDPADEQGPSWLLRARWLALSFAPSSLLLGVTTHIATDIASVPLLWVVPLALYLLTFVLVFARRQLLPHRWMLRVQPFFVLPLAAWFYLNEARLNWLILPLHLATFFVVAMVCHGELAATRPKARWLTEFYLWMSVGGVLGGLLNAIVAPLVFTSVIEYPLVVVLACMFRPRLWPGPVRNRSRVLDLVFPAVLGLAMLGAVEVLTWWYGTVTLLYGGILLGVGAMLCLGLSIRPVRFALGVAVLMFVGARLVGEDGTTLCRERNFFGVVRVKYSASRDANVLVHGSTTHGMQSCDPQRRREPLTYYHRTGPLGQIFDALGQLRPIRRVGAIGLGTGSIAAYGQPGQELTFYEIDPAILRIAENPRWFTYLDDSLAEVRVILGDARLTLASAPPQTYDLLVLDAFSSDSIPMHLVTREAVGLYLQKLAPEGLLALHISNRYLELAPILGRLAHQAGLVCRVQLDRPTDEEKFEGKLSSHWAVMARRESDLGRILEDSRWEPADVPPGTPLWTDDFSNILSVFHWRD